MIFSFPAAFRKSVDLRSPFQILTAVFLPEDKIIEASVSTLPSVYVTADGKNMWSHDSTLRNNFTAWCLISIETNLSSVSSENSSGNASGCLTTESEARSLTYVYLTTNKGLGTPRSVRPVCRRAFNVPGVVATVCGNGFSGPLRPIYVLHTLAL